MKLQVAQVVGVTVSLLITGRANAAFVATARTVGTSSRSAAPFVQHINTRRSSSLHQSLQPESFTDALSSMPPAVTAVSVNSMWLATVDSDLAKLSDNEFAPVFFGGVMVMVGGVISALIVGLILDKRDLYANVVADSYAQGNAEDEAFWKGLSDEEKKKTQDAIQRLRQSKGQSAEPSAAVVPSSLTVATSVASEPETASVAAPAPARAVVETGASQTAKKLDMFSDYADS